MNGIAGNLHKSTAAFVWFLLAIPCIGADGSDMLFQPGRIIEIAIEIPPGGIASLEKDSRNYVKATVKHHGESYPDVGIHLKGYGTFRPVGDKPNFTLKFNRFVPRQQFHGLNKMMLNNSLQDASHVAGMLCSELFTAAGVPAARMTHARVRLNGRDLGLYVLAEGMTKSFLRRHFPGDTGNLYEPSVQDIDKELDQDNGDSHDQSDLKALADAAHESDPTTRLHRLAKHLDIDRFLTFVAMEMISWHGDGFTLNRNNCRIYHDPTTDKFVFITHGLDQMFAQPYGSIMPPMKEILVAALLQSPEGRQRYRQRAFLLLTNVFNIQAVTNRIAELVLPVLQHLRADEPAMAKVLEESAVSLRERIVLRTQHLEKELLASEAPPVKFDESGNAQIIGWGPRGNTEAVTLDQQGEPPALHIDARETTTASWRVRIFLEAGSYRFAARARTAAVVPIADGSGKGAGVRISNAQQVRENKIDGDSPWRSLHFDFEVDPPSGHVELVCELRAKSGEVWFDKESLKLTRLTSQRP